MVPRSSSAANDRGFASTSSRLSRKGPMLHWVRQSKVGHGAEFGILARVRQSTIGAYVRVGAGSLILKAQIGSHSYLGHYCTVQEAEIGTYCSISWNVTVIGIGAHP